MFSIRFKQNLLLTANVFLTDGQRIRLVYGFTYFSMIKDSLCYSKNTENLTKFQPLVQGQYHENIFKDLTFDEEENRSERDQVFSMNFLVNGVVYVFMCYQVKVYGKVCVNPDILTFNLWRRQLVTHTGY